MKQHITLVDIQTLIGHEQVDAARLEEMCVQIRMQGVIRRPVIVDRESNVILDGHHRVQALRKFGAKRVPVLYVRYSDETVRVYFRRNDLLMKFIKRLVVDMAKSHVLFPSKTTRHLIVDRPRMRPIKVEVLQQYWRS